MSRTVLVAITIVLALVIYDTLDKFLSISGALTCTPLAFILPASFHLKILAQSKCDKCLDIFIIVTGLIIMVFCTGYGIYTWNL